MHFANLLIVQHPSSSMYLVCVFVQVADFGLSKDLQEGTYYVSSGGKIPVKWTAPEVLRSMYHVVLMMPGLYDSFGAWKIMPHALLRISLPLSLSL